MIDRNSVDAIQSDDLKEYNSAQNASRFNKKRRLTNMNAVLIALVLVGPNRVDLTSYKIRFICFPDRSDASALVLSAKDGEVARNYAIPIARESV